MSRHKWIKQKDDQKTTETIERMLKYGHVRVSFRDENFRNIFEGAIEQTIVDNV